MTQQEEIQLEQAQRARLAEINKDPGSRSNLEAQHGQVWDIDELRADFEVMGFVAPWIVVRRKSDNVKGSLEFQHSPRFYWGFTEDCG